MLSLSIQAAVLLLIFSPLSNATLNDQASQQVFSNSNEAFNSIQHALTKASIIPEVLDDFIPKCFVGPYYGKKHRSVTLGNTIKPSKVQIPPSLKIYCPNLNSTAGLTIVLTDPDAPSRENPEWSEVCHWIATVPAGMSRDQGTVVDLSLERGGVEDVIEYKPPGPPPKTGFHRYVFVLLQGKNDGLAGPKERRNWGSGKEGHGVRGWAKEVGLEVVGANFFTSKNKKQKGP